MDGANAVERVPPRDAAAGDGRARVHRPAVPGAGWNEAFWSLNLSSAKAGTLAALIASYSSPEGLFWAKLSAASLMAIAPIVVFGWFSQKQLVQGLTFGAVK